MFMFTPFFPEFRSWLAALGRRTQRPRQYCLMRLEQLFGRLIPPGLLAQADEGANSRDRIYSVRRTFWGFLYQVLNPGCPCRRIVRQIRAFFRLHHLGPVEAGTGGYCQARLRLPEDLLSRIRRAVADHADQCRALQPSATWYGLRPKVIDGTTVSAPDTRENQRAYPQPGAQKPGCGFPLLKLVGIFSLASGALLDYAKGNKHQHELTLLRKLLDHFQPGDLALADRGFSAYVLIALFLLRQVQCLFRLHQARPADLRRGQRLGKQDRLFTWRKPALKPRYLPQSLWKRIPQGLSVRVLRCQLQVPGYRPQSVTLVTTLTDARTYPALELARLYVRRWRIELWFRDIKTTMGMEVLHGQSPRMLHKELEMFLIAYNLIRALIVEAGVRYEVPVERLSFKGAVDSVHEYSLAIGQARSRRRQGELVADLLAVLAEDEVPDRPGRREPRAVKRRPKPFAVLNKPRHEFKDTPHRNRYKKNHPRKTRA